MSVQIQPTNVATSTGYAADRKYEEARCHEVLTLSEERDREQRTRHQGNTVNTPCEASERRRWRERAGHAEDAAARPMEARTLTSSVAARPPGAAPPARAARA